MPKTSRHIEIVPVWRRTVDRNLLLQALLALLAQVETEAKADQLTSSIEEFSND
jgi:hypothetical protein